MKREGGDHTGWEWLLREGRAVKKEGSGHTGGAATEGWCCEKGGGARRRPWQAKALNGRQHAQTPWHARR